MRDPIEAGNSPVSRLLLISNTSNEVKFPMAKLNDPLNALPFNHKYCSLVSWAIESGIEPPIALDAISLQHNVSALRTLPELGVTKLGAQ